MVMLVPTHHKRSQLSHGSARDAIVGASKIFVLFVASTWNMYCPRTFAQKDFTKISELLQRFPLATVFASGDRGPTVDHIPLLLSSPSVSEGSSSMLLRGHIARANPLWKAVRDGTSVIAVFHGPQAYVSASYYPSKKDGGKVVPTWNYATVHAHGNIRFFHAAEELRSIVDDLTTAMEAEQTHPWSIDDAPQEYIDVNLKAIVRVEIAVERIEGKWKMSQNKTDADFVGTVNGIGTQEGKYPTPAAEMMKSLRPNLRYDEGSS